MITANKYLNLDLSVIMISSLIIKHLKKNKFLKYDELSLLVVAELGEKSTEVLLYAVNFLFVLGKVSYDQETDAFYSFDYQLNEIK